MFFLLRLLVLGVHCEMSETGQQVFLFSFDFIEFEIPTVFQRLSMKSV